MSFANENGDIRGEKVGIIEGFRYERKWKREGDLRFTTKTLGGEKEYQ
jgi:hypothetical protein